MSDFRVAVARGVTTDERAQAMGATAAARKEKRV